MVGPGIARRLPEGGAGRQGQSGAGCRAGQDGAGQAAGSCYQMVGILTPRPGRGCGLGGRQKSGVVAWAEVKKTPVPPSAGGDFICYIK